MIRSLLFFLPAAIALAQISSPSASDSALKAPLLGYLVSTSPVSVRPIAGAPGAVVLGGAISLPAGITSISAAPGQPFAIVEQAGASQSGVLALSLEGAGEVASIANSFAHSDRIAFSPSGSTAVLYSATARRAQVITGLPANPRLNRTVDLSASGNSDVTSIAVSDDGQTILAGVSDGAQGAIWNFTSGQSAQQVTAAGVPSAMRFFSGKKDAVAVDRGWRQVLLLPSASAARTVAGAVEGIGAPADVEISADQQTIWVADGGAADSTPLARRKTGRASGQPTGRMFRIDVGSGAVTSMDSSVAAATLMRLAGDSAFLLISQDGASAGVLSSTGEGGSAMVWKLTGASVE